MMNELSKGLRDLAGDVEVVDLRDRSIRHSRRLRARRAAVAMGGAMCLVAALIVGGSALWNGGGKVPPAGVVDSADAAGQGTGFYLKNEPDGAYAVYSWREGTPPERVLAGDARFGTTVSVSPDGRYAAYYDESAMIVKNLADQSQVTSVQGVGDACLEPAWSPDSMSVLLSTATSAQLVDLGAGTSIVSEVRRPEGCHARLVQYDEGFPGYVAVSPDGDRITYTDSEGGGAFAAATKLPAADATPVAVNGDGSLMCLSVNAVSGEATRRNLACDVFATREGVDESVALPVDGAKLLGAVFTLERETMAVPFTGDSGSPSAASSGPEVEPSDVGTQETPAATEVALRLAVSGKTLLVRAGLIASHDTDGSVIDLAGFQTVRTFEEPGSLTGAALLTFVP